MPHMDPMGDVSMFLPSVPHNEAPGVFWGKVVATCCTQYVKIEIGKFPFPVPQAHETAGGRVFS